MSVDVSCGVDTPAGALVLNTAILETALLTNKDVTSPVTVNLALETTLDAVKVVGVKAAGIGWSDPLN